MSVAEQTVLDGVNQELVKSLRKNFTLKEGTGVSTDMGLDKLEARAKEIWPDLYTVLVSRNDQQGYNQVNEYEGRGFVLLEDGIKSRVTVPNGDMARVGCLLSEWNALEDERVKNQNSIVGYTPENAPEGAMFQQELGAQSLGSILDSADRQTQRINAEKQKDLDLLKDAGLKD